MSSSLNLLSVNAEFKALIINLSISDRLLCWFGTINKWIDPSSFFSIGSKILKKEIIFLSSRKVLIRLFDW